MRSKFTPESPEPSIQKPTGYSTTLLLKHASTHGDQQTPAPGPHSVPPHPHLRRTRAGRQHQACKTLGHMWGGFAAATDFYIFKKKKSHVQGQNDKGCFPTPAPESPRVQRQKGQLTFLTTWGSSFHPPLPHLPPTAWLKAPLALRKGNSMSAPIQRRGSCFQRKRQNRAASQEKEKTRCCPGNPAF